MDKIHARDFADMVHGFWPQWPSDYVEREARGVLDGRYSSSFPAAGSDVFYIRRDIDMVIASTRPKGGNIKEFELV